MASKQTKSSSKPVKSVSNKSKPKGTASSVADLISGLKSLAKNMWWSWNVEAQEVFEALSPRFWSLDNHNPSDILNNVSEQELQARLRDPDFAKKVETTLKNFNAYLSDKNTWASKNAKEFSKNPVAYFSAEFGLHESLPIYSGGLGVLAGDHIKSASDLGLNFVGVSLYYREGYFQQKLSHDGWQQENYPLYAPKILPFELVTDSLGKPLIVSVEIGHSTVYLQAWAVRVGRATLYLLDANLEQNEHHYRDITSRVYGGDSTTRINQEIVLGIGGVRFLHAMGIKPAVYHMNEGHSAFLTLELLREEILSGKGFEAAKKAVKDQCVFTTHTPVPAGHDRFSSDLMHYSLDLFLKKLNIGFETLMDLGREVQGDKSQLFTMTVLCLNLSRTANGVSELHGEVSRKMWKSLYGVSDQKKVPIGHITNGIHTYTWMGEKSVHFWARKSKGDLAFFTDRKKLKSLLDSISDEELWAHRYTLRRDVVEFVRQRLDMLNHNHIQQLSLGEERVMSPDVLTIGFARRFATYKRAPLIFSDLKRIAAIINNPQRPVQIIFAGKAHPKDNGGKKFIQDIFNITRMTPFLGKVVFLENYDMNVTRQLISGVDVWLNNPLRPLEASGTSGQKVIAHGGLNFSVLDGWWREGYNGKNGFSIGKDESIEDQEAQTHLDALSLYDTLENHLVPTFYNRDKNGIPKEWIKMIRQSIETLLPVYNTHRMVSDYIMKYYKSGASKK
ncbi:MAG: alpha-glucan family phosphorylase [Chloroherpetonaceae bacterium]|nr:alpha-glucan family phosphorylase [Chloroherpetonaceae bacterium]